MKYWLVCSVLCHKDCRGNRKHNESRNGLNLRDHSLRCVVDKHLHVGSEKKEYSFTDEWNSNELLVIIIFNKDNKPCIITAYIITILLFLTLMKHLYRFWIWQEMEVGWKVFDELHCCTVSVHFGSSLELTRSFFGFFCSRLYVHPLVKGGIILLKNLNHISLKILFFIYFKYI